VGGRIEKRDTGGDKKPSGEETNGPSEIVLGGHWGGSDGKNYREPAQHPFLYGLTEIKKSAWMGQRATKNESTGGGKKPKPNVTFAEKQTHEERKSKEKWGCRVPSNEGGENQWKSLTGR